MKRRAVYAYGERRSVQEERARAWLEKKWTEPHECPICAEDDWSWEEPASVATIGRSIYRRTAGHGTMPGDVPIWMMICRNCGYTHFFNAVRTKVVRTEDYSLELLPDDE